MSTVKLRKEIKSVVDRLSREQLASVADYVQFISRPSIAQQVHEAEKAITKGNGTSWRQVRTDV